MRNTREAVSQEREQQSRERLILTQYSPDAAGSIRRQRVASMVGPQRRRPHIRTPPSGGVRSACVAAGRSRRRRFRRRLPHSRAGHAVAAVRQRHVAAARARAAGGDARRRLRARPDLRRELAVPRRSARRRPAPRPLGINISTEETMTGRLMFGVGINSDAGLVGSVVLDEQNFDWTRFPTSWEDIRNATAWRGAGQRFRLEAVPGTQVQRYMVTFQEPYMFGSQVSMSLNGYYYNRIYNEYTDQRLGGRIGFGYQFTPALSAGIAYRGAKINITNPIDPALARFGRGRRPRSGHARLRIVAQPRTSATTPSSPPKDI